MILEDLLDHYEAQLGYVERMLKYVKEKDKDIRNIDYWDGYLRATTSMLHNTISLLAVKLPTAAPTDEDKEKYKEYISDIHSLSYMIIYRGKRIPVFFDDYGQQMDALIGNELIGGGTYNDMADYDFVYMSDLHDNQEMLDKAKGE